MDKKIFMLIGVTISLCLILTPYSHAQDYPTKPIELYSGYTPGSTYDITARLIAEITSKYVGQPIVVVNKPGAAGSVAASEIINSKPDGYKFIMLPSTFLALTVKTQKVSFDPNHLIPIASLAEIKSGFFVKGDSPWKTFADLISYAKKNPGKLSWTHAGRGTILHISTTAIFKKAGVEAIEIPSKGSPEMTAAILGGHIDAASGPYSAQKESVRAGKVKYLVFYSDHRYTDPPNVPCAVDVGFPEVGRFSSLGGLYIHKDTPEKIIRILFNALKKAYEDQGFKNGIANLGEEARFETAEFNKEYIKKAEEIGVPLLKSMGLYVER
jgi:tripartite-type tricarboxylate transporter receptor subunit TctC